MKLRALLGLAATAGLLSFSTAHAAPFIIDIGVDVNGDGSTQTSTIDELGYTGTLATSIYLGDPTVAGTSVIDTNKQSVMDLYGFTPGSHTATDGETTVNFQYTQSPGQNNIDALNFQGGDGTGNGFVSGVGGFPNSYGIAGTEGTTWGITYDYEIYGQTTGTGVAFDSGFFDVFFEDGTNRIQVLRLDVTGSDLQAANLDIFGAVSYDFAFAAGFEDLIQGMFIDAATGETFYDLWLNGGEIDELAVRWILDTNINPPIPTADQLVDTGDALIRQTTLDGSVTFEARVPEPGTLALMGLGLLGLGLSRRIRKA